VNVFPLAVVVTVAVAIADGVALSVGVVVVETRGAGEIGSWAECSLARHGSWRRRGPCPSEELGVVLLACLAEER